MTFGHPVVKCLRSKVPRAMFDMHMMVAQPEKWIADMHDSGADQYTFHIEVRLTTLQGDHLGSSQPPLTLKKSFVSV